MAGQGDAVRGDAEEHGAPAVHACLGPARVVIGNDEVDLHAPADAAAELPRDLFGALELLAAGEERFAVGVGQAVVLGIGELDVVGLELGGHVEDLPDVVDVEAVQHDVEHHRIAVLLDHARHPALQLEGARAREEVVHLAGRVLERDLDVVEPGALERRNAPLVQPDARGDEIRVVAEAPRLGRERLQIVAHQRLAAREAELGGAELATLAQHAQPVLGRELVAVRGVVDRVGAIHAVQRAAVGQLREQPERWVRPADTDPSLVAGMREKVGHVAAQIGAGKGALEVGDDGRHGRGAVDALEDLPRARAELHHALGVEQHVGLLRRFPLETVVPRQLEHGVFTHSPIPICELHRVEHAPEHVELELQDLERALLLLAGPEMLQRHLQAVLHVAARFGQPAPEVGVARRVDPGIVLRPARQALLVDLRREELGERRAYGFLPGARRAKLTYASTAKRTPGST